MAVPLIIEVQLDDTSLQSGLEKLVQQGQVDQSSAVIFKKTNTELAARKGLIDDSKKSTDLLTISVSKNQEIYNKLAASVKTLSGASKEAAQELLKATPDRLAASFKLLNTNVDEYITLLQETSVNTEQVTDESIKLSTELRVINDAMAKLRLEGKENSEEFRILTERLQEVGKAAADQRESFKSLTSDTPVLSALQSGVEGLTGAFEVGIGVTGLFGEKNKELEETLIRVNSIMVFAQGATAVFNTLKKESALMTFLSLSALKAENAQREIEIALTSESTAVKAGAIAAQKALNFAMAANPIGLLVVGLSALIVVLGAYFNASEKARREEEKFNDALRDNGLLQEHIKNLTANSEFEISELKKRNAKESEITQKQADDLREINRLNAEQIEKDQKVIDDARLKRQLEANKAVAAATGGSVTVAQDFIEATEAEKKFQEDINKRREELAKKQQEQLLVNNVAEKTAAEETLQIQRDLANAVLNTKISGSRAFFAAERVATNAALALELKDAGDNEGKKAIARSTAARKLREIDATEKAQAAEDEVNLETANLLKIQTETRRINTQISREETQAQIQLINTRAAAEIAALQKQAEQDITFRVQANAKIAQIEAQRIQQTEQLQRDQLIREIALFNNNEIARRNVLLAGIQITNKKRLELQLANEDSQRAIELTNTALTEEQKLAIIEQSEQRKRDLRNASIIKTGEDEIAQTQANNAAENAELERQLAAQDQIRNSHNPQRQAELLKVPILNIDQQLAGIDKLTKANTDAIDKRISDNFELQQTQEEFAKKEVELEAQRIKAIQDGENKKILIIENSAKKQVDINARIRDEALAGVASGLQILGNLYQQQDQAAQARLDRQRSRIQEELDAGAITAKAALARNKELDAQQKQLQREQAKRNKELAIFQAIIGTAQAVISAAATIPFIPLGLIAVGIAAALGAAQIAVISAQPLPAFYRGKNQEKGKQQRDQYEGWATAGEKGAELWQSGSQTKLVEKSTVIWVKKGDIIYNASQTAAMMKSGEVRGSMASPLLMNGRIPTVVINNQVQQIDMKKLTEIVSKKSPVILNIDGYKEFIQSEKNFTETLNARRKWQ